MERDGRDAGVPPNKLPNNAEKKSWAEACVDRPAPASPHITPNAIRCLDIHGIGFT
jgi:hypothetical protein